jgi:sugar (pentulose or hexulose) kinase
MADDQDAIDGRELTPLGTVVAVGQLDVEAGALGLDAVADGEVIGSLTSVLWG